MTILPRPAQYLLRVDDLCPTVRADSWGRLLALIVRFAIRPILGLVPDNQDVELDASPPDPRFWDDMRRLQSAGATIALHGYQHRCDKESKNIFGLQCGSEFAGLLRSEQQSRLSAGLNLLRGQGLNPTVWIAPRHSFDANTLAALRALDISIVSDGLARVPFRRDGLTWIPQQLWAPQPRREGLWTICLHPNTMRKADFTELEYFLRHYGTEFTSVDAVLRGFRPQVLGTVERVYERVAALRLHSRVLGRQLTRWGTFYPGSNPHRALPKDRERDPSCSA